MTKGYVYIGPHGSDVLYGKLSDERRAFRVLSGNGIYAINGDNLKSATKMEHSSTRKSWRCCLTLSKAEK